MDTREPIPSHSQPNRTQTHRPLQVGIDIGGTFTDFVLFWPGEGRVETFKLLSTPHDPAEAVLEGISRIIASALAQDGSTPALSIVHGSTVATNALLERKGARTALVTTRGFRDVLQIGRQNREALYSLAQTRPPALIPEELRFVVDERVDSEGQVLHPLDPAQVDALLPELEARGVESVAVCLIFSFLHPEHEARIAERLRSAGCPVSLSSEILPEYREYERFSTTAVNAYVSPVLDRYLASLEVALPGLGAGRIPLRVMQSNGGVISPAEARREGVRCLLSGPAGGVAGSGYLAALASAAGGREGAPQAPSGPKLITFDMGGTSTDVSLIDGSPRLTTEAVVGGCPIRIPVLDIHTIGAGGGSIAWVDPGGALRVGPESAGAYPGPACYGRAPLEECRPTVTDANLVLGRLAPEYFLGGEMPLDPERALEVLRRLGAELRLDPVQTALGVVEVAHAHMERALQLISVERGYDPREFSLLSFGGAGGLHAAALARRLGIPKVLIPPVASTLSAFGMLAADAIRDYSQTVMLPAGPETPRRLLPVFSRLEAQGLEDLQREGFDPDLIQFQRSLDMRYRGQSYELSVAWAGGANASPEALVEHLLQDFHQIHRQAYGTIRPEAPVEIVNARLRAAAPATPPALAPAPLQGSDPSPALLEHRPVYLPEGQYEAPFYRGERLQPGNRIGGAAAVVRTDTTIWTGPSDRAEVDPYGNLIILVGGEPA